MLSEETLLHQRVGCNREGTQRSLGLRIMRNRNKHFLLPYNKFHNATESTSSITTNGFGFPLTRPLRPHAVEVRYAHINPVGIRFRIYAGNGEEVYVSPALVAGPAPQVFKARLPANTDFAMYGPSQIVMDFAGASTWAVRLTMAHKENSA